MECSLSTDRREVGDSFGMIQAHSVYCVLYFPPQILRHRILEVGESCFKIAKNLQRAYFYCK